MWHPQNISSSLSIETNHSAINIQIKNISCIIVRKGICGLKLILLRKRDNNCMVRIILAQAAYS
jgi:hypothetical protein